MQQSDLNDYFNNSWRDATFKHTSSIDTAPDTLKNKILPHETVLDVGCGVNQYKNIIPNLVGIDPAFDEADVKCTIEEYQTDQLFDVAFCFGSINFGSRETIINQIAKTVSLLKPTSRIYWRTNPAEKDHADNSAMKDFSFYPWTNDDHIEFAKMFGYNVTELRKENRTDNRNRIYAVWER